MPLQCLGRYLRGPEKARPFAIPNAPPSWVPGACGDLAASVAGSMCFIATPVGLP